MFILEIIALFCIALIPFAYSLLRIFLTQFLYLPSIITKSIFFRVTSPITIPSCKFFIFATFWLVKCVTCHYVIIFATIAYLFSVYFINLFLSKAHPPYIVFVFYILASRPIVFCTPYIYKFPQYYRDVRIRFIPIFFIISVSYPICGSYLFKIEISFIDFPVLTLNSIVPPSIIYTFNKWEHAIF